MVKKAAVASAAVVLKRGAAHHVAVAGLHREAKGRGLEVRVHQVCNADRGLSGLQKFRDLQVASRILVEERSTCRHPI